MKIFGGFPRTLHCYGSGCWIILLLNVLLPTTVVVVESKFSEARFTQLVAQVELDVLDFAEEIEREFQFKCSSSSKQSCQAKNYDMCSSLYPNQECLGGPNYYIKGCSGDRAENSTCSGLYSFNVSTVRIPAAEMKALNGNPTDTSVMEAICSTRGMDVWLQKRRETNQEFWSTFAVDPRAWYFGSTSGAFRIWPARQSEDCGEYDPRLRPWYVAGGSGPKNIILLIDISNSMSNGGRLDVAKLAAERVVSTLTISDRITIIPFSDNATAFTDSELMFRANQTNKDYLIQQIRNLNPVGQTNFGDAFQLAFDIFDATIDKEEHADCNSAILFLTDGKRTSGMAETQLTTLVQNRTQAISNRLGKPVLLFTYSISNDPEVHQYPAQLACAVERGVWTRIPDSFGILDALSSYYRLFALGLGTAGNRDFVAWVEPYNFSTGNILGTTVSVPVFDRSQTPHVFLGVVGVDISLQALDIALGGNVEEARAESINRVVLASDASCPPQLDLTKCEILAWSNTGDVLQQCSDVTNCTQLNVLQTACPANMTYPDNLFVNFDLKGKTFESRVCCIVNTTVATDQCPAYDSMGALDDGGGGGGGNDSSSVNIVAIAVPAAIGGVIILGLLIYFVPKYRRSLQEKREKEKEQQANQARAPPFNPSSQNMVNSASAPEQEIIFTSSTANPVATIPPPPFQPASRSTVTTAMDPEMALPIRTESPAATRHPPPPFQPVDRSSTVHTMDQEIAQPNHHTEAAPTTRNLPPPPPPPFRPAFTILNSANRNPSTAAETSNVNRNSPPFQVETGQEASAGNEDDNKKDSSDSDSDSS